MAIPTELIELLDDPTSIKIVTTTDKTGIPCSTFNPTLILVDRDLFAFRESLDTSDSNRNLVRSIWFDEKVSIAVSDAVTSYHIVGRPYKCVITGPLFRSFLENERAKHGTGADIAAVWLIQPESIIDVSVDKVLKKSNEERPLSQSHLDRDGLLKAAT